MLWAEFKHAGSHRQKEEKRWRALKAEDVVKYRRSMIPAAAGGS